MTDTANLGLPLIDGSQAQKHVTHNEALQILDDVIQISVLDTTLTTPPATPAEGERHIVPTGATGAWSGQTAAIAIWDTDAWRFVIPKTGWLAWSVATGAMLVFGGTVWGPVTTAGASSLDNAAHVGINTSTSSPNLLAVRSNAALFNAIDTAGGGSGDVRLQISKSSSANTASVFFSDAFSGRAEFGLTGDDDFHLKVSADGGTWHDAMTFDRSSGRVAFPSGGSREVLAANRTYYVRTDGNDANNGLANTSGGAFLTIQKAVDAVCALDLSVFQVTIQVGDGTYTSPVVLKPYLGALPPILKGNTATPSNVLISTTGASAISVALPCVWQVNDMKLATTTAGNGLQAGGGGTINFQNINFGVCAAYQIFIYPSSSVIATGSYAVSGSAQFHIAATGYVNIANRTITYSGSLAFSGANILSGRGGVVDAYGVTFVNGSGVSGPRYAVSANGVIFTNSGGASYFPGSTAGSASSGGQYL